jgi:hypothetical protein
MDTNTEKDQRRLAILEREAANPKRSLAQRARLASLANAQRNVLRLRHDRSDSEK